MLCSLLGGVVMASSRDLVTIFIAIELISIPAFVMAALRKGDAKSNEGALKFFLFSVLSSAVMLYGMSLVYGVTGRDRSSTGSEATRSSCRADEPLIVLSVFFVVVGFAFKISAVPFHFWAPDTYEGAPSPVAAFLSTASKIGGFVGLLVLMFRAFPEVADTWRPAVRGAGRAHDDGRQPRSPCGSSTSSGCSPIRGSPSPATCSSLWPSSTRHRERRRCERRRFSAALIYLAIYGDHGPRRLRRRGRVRRAEAGTLLHLATTTGLWERAVPCSPP